MDKLLFTPGPLTTSASVKAAMQRDLGSRDKEFVEVVSQVRRRLLELAGVSGDAGYEAVLIPGSGTYAVEAVVGSALTGRSEGIVFINGAYGRRIQAIAERMGLEIRAVVLDETEVVTAERVSQELKAHPDASHVAVVHLETTTGILNPIAEIGAAVRAESRHFIVDSMSAFGATTIDARAIGIDFLISSSNKCLEGVPGLAFVIARRSELLACEGRSRSLSLDLFAQWSALEQTGQFRFTPPTHVILALRQALEELEREGGVEARARRYRASQREIVSGMRQLGFEELLDTHLQGSVITTFRYLCDSQFDFELLYRGLSRRGFVIYPGKLSQCESFRIGTCGHIDVDDVRALLEAVRETLLEMKIDRGSAVT